MAEVSEVGNVKLRLPAGEGLDEGEHVHHVVDANVGNLTGMESVQSEFVHLEAGDNAEASQKVVRHAEFTQGMELGHLA